MGEEAAQIGTVQTGFQPGPLKSNRLLAAILRSPA